MSRVAKYTLFAMTILLWSGCNQRSSKTKQFYPFRILIGPVFLGRHEPGIGRISVTGDDRGITQLTEKRYFMKGDKIYVAVTDFPAGSTDTIETNEWSDPLSSEIRADLYRRLYDLITRSRELFEKASIADFFAVTGSTPPTLVMILHSPKGLGGVADFESVTIRFEHSNKRLFVASSSGFKQKELLHHLFPDADFSTVGRLH